MGDNIIKGMCVCVYINKINLKKQKMRGGGMEGSTASAASWVPNTQALARLLPSCMPGTVALVLFLPSFHGHLYLQLFLFISPMYAWPDCHHPGSVIISLKSENKKILQWSCPTPLLILTNRTSYWFLHSHCIFPIFFFFSPVATPMAYGGFQAMCQVRAAAEAYTTARANTGSEMSLWLTLQLVATWDP